MNGPARTLSPDSLVNSWPASVSWAAANPLRAPAVRALAGVSPTTGLQTSCLVNSDGLCPADGYLQAAFTAPPGVTAVAAFVAAARLPAGVASTSPTTVQVLDGLGLSVLDSLTVAPTATPRDVQGSPATVTPGVEYLVRVLCAPSGVQGQILVDALGVRPVAVAPPANFWSTAVRVDPLGALDRNTASPWYDDPLARYPRQDARSRVVLETDATEIWIAWFCSSLYYLGATGAADTQPLVDGELGAPFAPTVDGAVNYEQRPLPALPAGATRTVEVVSGEAVLGGYPAPNVANRATLICAVWVPAGSNTRVLQVPVRRLAAIGDSKLSFYDVLHNFPRLLEAHGYRVETTSSSGGNSIANTFGTTLTVDACAPSARAIGVHQPDLLWFEIGRNDYTANTFNSDAALEQQAGNAIDAYHANCPTGRVVVPTWSTEQGLPGELDQPGSTTQAVRDAFAALTTSTGADGRPRSVWSVSTPMGQGWSSAEASPANTPQFSTDGVHDAAEGHQRSLTALQNVRFLWAPAQTAPAILFVVGAGGATTGGTPGPVTGSSGSGAPLPTVTMGGNLTVCEHVYMRVVAGNSAATAVFDVSFNSGASFPFRGLTAATCNAALAATGLTVALGADHPYDNLMIFQADPIQVASVLDQSGNGRTLARVGVGFNRSPAGIGGWPTLVTVGATGTMAAALPAIPGPYTVFGLWQLAVATVGQAMVGNVGASSGAPTIYTGSGSEASMLVAGAQINVSVDVTRPRTYVGVVAAGAGALRFRVDGNEAAGTAALPIPTLTGLQVAADGTYAITAAPGMSFAVLGALPYAATTQQIRSIEAWLSWLKTPRWTP